VYGMPDGFPFDSVVLELVELRVRAVCPSVSVKVPPLNVISFPLRSIEITPLLAPGFIVFPVLVSIWIAIPLEEICHSAE